MDIRTFDNLWLLGLSGILLIMFGLVIISGSQYNILSVTLIFGYVYMLSGALQMLFTIIKKKIRWRAWFVEGALGIGIGLYIVLIYRIDKIIWMGMVFWALGLASVNIINFYRIQKSITVKKIYLYLRLFCTILFAGAVALNIYYYFLSWDIMLAFFAIFYGFFTVLYSMKTGKKIMEEPVKFLDDID